MVIKRKLLPFPAQRYTYVRDIFNGLGTTILWKFEIFRFSATFSKFQNQISPSGVEIPTPYFGVIRFSWTSTDVQSEIEKYYLPDRFCLISRGKHWNWKWFVWNSSIWFIGAAGGEICSNRRILCWIETDAGFFPKIVRSKLVQASNSLSFQFKTLLTLFKLNSLISLPSFGQIVRNNTLFTVCKSYTTQE